GAELMSTLAKQRKAMRDQMRAERGTGSQMAAERRAIGDAMVARRRGEQQVDDLNAVVRPPAQRRALRRIEPRGGLPAQKGRGNYVPPRATPGAGGGIASPLVE